MTKAGAPRLTHDCPGDCGTPVPNHRYACKSCWYRLPRPIRDAINRNYRKDAVSHLQAMAEARRWYRAAAEAGAR